MNGWLHVSGSLQLCNNHADFLRSSNQTDDGLMKQGWIKLTNGPVGHAKWEGADLEHATPEQVATIQRFHTLYGGSMPSIIRRKSIEVRRGVRLAA